ncbi:MAG TPA: hypothetical protein VH144_02030 [Candidatus Saccharimonadales bacterium]|jgi:hypothetical protein|nr:hypothetical protein [Candidatus Saccharimonadales bacterium]
MNNNQQAILARDMIQMIREYKDDSNILEYLDSFAFSIARMLEKSSITNWDDIAGVCDQRYYSLKMGDPVRLNEELLHECEIRIKKYLPNNE